MSAFACVKCGQPVTAQNPMAQKLMEQGGRLPMCRDCMRGKTAEKQWDSYEDYLKSPQWKALADACKQRDGHRCRLCNSPEKLQAHHRTYERKYNERLEDLTTLCDDCHEWYTAYEKSRDNGRQLVHFAPVTFSLD